VAGSLMSGRTEVWAAQKWPGSWPVPHRFLHAIGLLDCCQAHGCWKKQGRAAERRDPSLCKYPIVRPGQAVPKCLDMDHAPHVIEAVMSYYEDKTLLPIKPIEEGVTVPFRSPRGYRYAAGHRIPRQPGTGIVPENRLSRRPRPGPMNIPRQPDHRRQVHSLCAVLPAASSTTRCTCAA
jgi:hypothetical protein